LEDFFEPPQKTKKKDGGSSSSSMTTTTSREARYPEQYPATYEPNTDVVREDDDLPEATLVRPLLKNTQLQSRPLKLVYSCMTTTSSNNNSKDASASSPLWNPRSFHSAVDGRGAAVVIATITTDRNGTSTSSRMVGGYNPKGWASLGGARPSVAAFLFYERSVATATTIATADTARTGDDVRCFQKLRKVGGGGLACARDDPAFGISFGPDGLVIGLQPSSERTARSKLGTYYERGPDDRSSLFDGGATSAELIGLKVLVGCYEAGEEIPYSGGVLDMTSG
jgi:hypothetical protein